MPGLELLARSLQDHAPGFRLLCFSGLQEARRIASAVPIVDIADEPIAASGWSVKPEVLLRTLERAPAALWLDTDVIVSGDLGRVIADFPDDALVVGEEFRYPQPGGCAARARAWKLEIGRDLRWMVNSGSVRVTRRHIPLLRQWQTMLQDPAFVAAQATPVSARPLHLLGDQDVLAALLASAQFGDVPLHYIRNGPDMVQHSGANGFHVVDRLRTVLSGPPAFVHMLGRYKPWSFAAVPDARHDRTDFFHLVCHELSPYHAAAQPYAAKLGNPPWLQRRTWLARTFNMMAMGNVPLRGLPLALLAWMAEWRRKGPPVLPGAGP